MDAECLWVLERLVGLSAELTREILHLKNLLFLLLCVKVLLSHLAELVLKRCKVVGSQVVFAEEIKRLSTAMVTRYKNDQRVYHITNVLSGTLQIGQAGLQYSLDCSGTGRLLAQDNNFLSKLKPSNDLVVTFEGLNGFRVEQNEVKKLLQPSEVLLSHSHH